MPWNPSTTTSAMTWTGLRSAYTETYSGTSAHQRSWEQLGARTSSTYSYGVNFNLYVNDQYPMRVDDAMPLYVIDEVTDI